MIPAARPVPAALLVIGAAAVTACGSSDRREVPATAATARDAAPPPPPTHADAAPPDAAPRVRPVDPATLPVLGELAGPGKVELAVVDLAVQHLASELPLGRLVVAPARDERITGRAAAASPAALAAALRELDPVALPPAARAPRGRAPKIDLAFGRAPIVDLYKLFADVERKSYVLAPGLAGDVTVLADAVPADAVAAAVASALGLAREPHGDLIYVHRADSPGLDPALVRAGGPTLDLDARGARPGELYALVAELGGAKQGAGCDRGEPVTLRVRAVSSGRAAAAIAATGGVAAGDAERCELPRLADAERTGIEAVRAIARRGERWIAVVDAPAPALVEGAGIAAGYVEAGPGVIVPLYPRQVRDRSATLEDVRLAATLIAGDRRRAWVEHPGGEVRILELPAPPGYALGGPPDGRVERVTAIERDRIRYTIEWDYEPDPTRRAPGWLAAPRPPEDREILLGRR
jgi:hypothetical protein